MTTIPETLLHMGRDDLLALCAQAMRERDDARAEVARLQAELAAARERGRWIPIGERLPKMGIWVQVWGRARGECAPGIPYGPSMGKAAWDGDHWEQYTWYTDDVDITHWRLLPAAPEVEK